MSQADAVVTGRPRLIDRYALRQSAGPLIACLVVLLAALLLERALRLFDLLSGSSARFGYVFELTANLLPHYWVSPSPPPSSSASSWWSPA